VTRGETEAGVLDRALGHRAPDAERGAPDVGDTDAPVDGAAPAIPAAPISEPTRRHRPAQSVRPAATPDFTAVASSTQTRSRFRRNVVAGVTSSACPVLAWWYETLVLDTNVCGSAGLARRLDRGLASPRDGRLPSATTLTRLTNMRTRRRIFMPLLGLTWAAANLLRPPLSHSLI
jgi:hypothetical protein